MSEAIDKLLEANAEAADKHRIAYGKEMFNLGVEHCIESIREFSKTNTLANDPFLYYIHLISKLEQLKKPLQ